MASGVVAKHGSELTGAGPARLADFRPWRPALQYCAGVYLAVRLGLFVLGAAAWGLTNEHAYPLQTPDHHILPVTNGWHNAVTGWLKMDAQQFLYVARHGYGNHDATAAFYPAYPMLIRVAGFLCFGHFAVAAYIVSNLALLAALVVLHRLTEREYDVHTARRAVLYLCLFPTAFFLFDAYSESLFLLAVVGAFALARRGHWVWAGLAGIAATLTRSMGVVVVLALAVEAVHQTLEDRKQTELSAGAEGGATARGLLLRGAGRLGASVMPLAGIGGYLLFWQLRYHDWHRPLHLENLYWHRQFSLPWSTLLQGLNMATRHITDAGEGWWTLDFIIVAVGLVLGVWVAVRARPVYAVYTWGSILFFLSETRPGRPLVSDPRYVVTIFPLVWALARLGQRPRAHEAILVASGASLAIVSWLFLGTLEIY